MLSRHVAKQLSDENHRLISLLPSAGKRHLGPYSDFTQFDSRQCRALQQTCLTFLNSSVIDGDGNILYGRPSHSMSLVLFHDAIMRAFVSCVNEN